MASFSELMRLLPRIALNILPGVMMGGGAASRILQRAVDKRIPGAALTYPDLDNSSIPSTPWAVTIRSRTLP